jgi:hypothetical protein
LLLLRAFKFILATKKTKLSVPPMLSRALLVSHWRVISDAPVRITTRMMEEAKKT